MEHVPKLNLCVLCASVVQILGPARAQRSRLSPNDTNTLSRCGSKTKPGYV